MKRLYFIIAIACLSLLACSSDDDNGNSGGTAKTKVGTLDKESSTRVKSVGDITYYYNEDGSLNYFSIIGSKFTFSTPYKLVETSRDGTEKYSGTINYNSSGNIVHIDGTFNYKEGSTTVTGSDTYSFNYDGSQHLTSFDYSETDTYRGEVHKLSESSTITWKNNMLIQVVREERESDNDLDADHFRMTFKYGYNDTLINDFHNVHHQYAQTVDRFLEDGLLRALAYVGLLGRGPLYLPESCTKTAENVLDTNDKVYTNTYSFSYGFNSNGSLSYAAIGSSRQNYTYEQISQKE